MKRTFDRFPLVFLVAILACSLLLTGCGGNQTGSDDFSQPVELVWYTPVNGDAPKDLPKVQEEINKYLKEKINATVQIKTVNFADYDQKMNVVVSSGEACDLAFTCSWTFGYNNAASRGYLYELNDLLDKYAPETKKAIPAEIWQGVSLNGKIFAVPNMKDMCYQQTYTFNKKYLDAVGADVKSIKSFADLEPVFAAVHAKFPDVTCLGTSTVSFPYDRYDYVMGDAALTPGAVLLSDPGCKVINQFTDDNEAVNRIKQYHEYYKKGYVQKEQGTSVAASKFENGKVLCKIEAYVPDMDSLFTRDYGFEVVSVPCYPRAVMSTMSVTGSMIAVTAASKHPERALAFLNLLNTDPKLKNMISLGIENVHYKMLGKNTYDWLPEHKDYSMPNFTLGSIFIGYLHKDDPANIWQQYEEFNKNGVRSPILGFVFDTAPVSSELAAINNIQGEYRDRLLRGTVDPEPVIKAYMEKCKLAGLDKVLAEMQKQVDAWKKTK